MFQQNYQIIYKQPKKWVKVTETTIALLKKNQNFGLKNSEN